MTSPVAPPPCVPDELAPAIHKIARGMELKKCRICGCMAEALGAAALAFGGSDDPPVRGLLPYIEEQQARMEPLAYDCIGCKKCWGADATVMLAGQFEEVSVNECGGSCGSSPADFPVVRVQDGAALPWPPYPGAYVLGARAGSVAVCTLSNRELAEEVIARNEQSIAIAGRCDTENIGVEKVVLNVLANPLIRSLILCGAEAQGHRTGDAFLHLKAEGVDANMRVLEAASWRPILKNLTLLDVAQFREQVEVVNLIGSTEVDQIVSTARELSASQASDLPQRTTRSRELDHIVARTPERLRLDPAGFFIVLPQANGTILLEHYENDGRLAHVIEGRQAAVIAATAVDSGLISRLDHAAYLGRELAKAEIAIGTGRPYEQDAALGVLPAGTPVEEPNATGDSGKPCGCR